MEERELEQRMLRFLRGDADVLVCTSIIESGIDIPQANTLIVERADAFGLAQLYQIRGRVGRTRERAYAYLLYPSAAALTVEAAQRLSALSDYTELGAGFKIAMRDLEIRGAGNLLGDEQSGHVAALGFELYMQMLDEAVGGARGRGRRGEDWEPVRLDVNVDAYVPADYIPYEQAKVDVHRRIAGSREVADLVVLRDELEDRFGELPEPLQQPDHAPDRRGSSSARPAPRPSPSAAAAWRSPRSSSTRCAPSASAQEIPEALYESGKSQLSLRVPDDPAERFPAVVTGRRRAAGGDAGGGVGRRTYGELAIAVARGRCRACTAPRLRRERPPALFDRSSTPLPTLFSTLIATIAAEHEVSDQVHPRRLAPFLCVRRSWRSRSPAAVAACPATRVADVSGNPITTKRRSTTGCTSPPRARPRSRPAAPVIMPDPPNYTKCVATGPRSRCPSLASTPADDAQDGLRQRSSRNCATRSWTS